MDFSECMTFLLFPIKIKFCSRTENRSLCNRRLCRQVNPSNQKKQCFSPLSAAFLATALPGGKNSEIACAYYSIAAAKFPLIFCRFLSPGFNRWRLRSFAQNLFQWRKVLEAMEIPHPLFSYGA
ncbi:hypothetical protein [Oscillibacter ruminantium]|uniref:hypothetical protein n=1 Tax=Oscillibacter ruminantium TaxID=1263547 RepID=UPI003325CC23